MSAPAVDAMPAPPEPAGHLAGPVASVDAQRRWASSPIRERLGFVRRLRRSIARSAEELAGTVRTPRRRSAAETLVAEVLPLAESCRFLERRATSLLRPRGLGSAGRPLWLGGVSTEIRREPWGTVLVIGPANYPLFLPAVQAVQALTAGNAVLWKPGRGGSEAAVLLRSLALAEGLEPPLLRVLDEDPRAVDRAIRSGIDKVLLTGSTRTGRELLGRLSRAVVPSTMELSGCDAVFVRPEADLEAVADALAFGLTFNAGATCIAPQRVFAPARSVAGLEAALADRLARVGSLPIGSRAAAASARALRAAVADGARVAVGGTISQDRMEPTVLTGVTPHMEIASEPLDGPVLSLLEAGDDEEAVGLAAASPYALGATIFGAEGPSRRLARRLDAGTVVLNDMIVPTADPRVPFGGRGLSGYGSTRGAEGLIELTRPKVVIARRGSRRPHFRSPDESHAPLLATLVRALHDTPLARLRALPRLTREVARTLRDTLSSRNSS